MLLEGDEPRRPAAELVTLIGSLLERGQPNPPSTPRAHLLHASDLTNTSPSHHRIILHLQRPTLLSRRCRKPMCPCVHCSPTPAIQTDRALSHPTCPLMPTLPRPVSLRPNRSSSSLSHHHRASPLASLCVIPVLASSHPTRLTNELIIASRSVWTPDDGSATSGSRPVSRSRTHACC